MAIKTLPSPARIRRIEWSLSSPAQSNVSAWTGTRTVVADPWHGKWRASVELAAMDATAMRDWRAFLGSLRGVVNTFRLPAAEEGAQNANSGVSLASDAAQGATTVTIQGAATAMLAGQHMTIGNQLLLITSASGNVLTFEPPLRASASAGKSVETSQPYALVAMADSTVGWSVDLGPVYGISFEAEEIPGINELASYALALDLSGGEYWVGGTKAASLSVLSGYTYTRSGAKMELSGTASVVSFGANVPGVVPGTGYWSRQALTNLFLHSQAFDNAAWAVFNATKTGTNNAASPEGPTTADSVSITSTGSVYQNIVFAANTTYTISIWAKRNAVTNQLFRLRGITAVGTYVYSANFTATDTWQRFSFTFTTGGAGFTGEPSIASESGASTAELFVWQADLRAGSIPDGGPMIVTTTATAAIGEDLLNGITYSALTNTDMLLIAHAKPSSIGDVQYAADYYLDGNNRIALEVTAAGLVQGTVQVGGATVYLQSIAGAVTPTQEVVIVLRRLSGAWQIGKYVGAVLTWGTSTAAAVPASTKIAVGNYQTGGFPLRGAVEKAGIKLGTFSTDAAVLAVIADL